MDNPTEIPMISRLMNHMQYESVYKLSWLWLLATAAVFYCPIQTD